MGGVATRRQLLVAGNGPMLDRHLAAGRIVRLSRGRYALPIGRDGELAARRLSGVAVARTAAGHWGWAMKWTPRRPQIAVPRGRRVSAEAQREYDVRWLTITDTDVVDGWVTCPVRTAIDCARSLPFDEALAIADSALRSRRVSKQDLEAACADLPNRGAAAVRRVVDEADARAANPFESVLRAIGLEVDGLHLEPQVEIREAGTGRFIARSDLVDKRLRIVAEAESFEFHGERELFERDCFRGNDLVLDGWLFLRFAWTPVMTRAHQVRRTLERATAAQSGRRPLLLPVTGKTGISGAHRQ